jgi:chorismate mutase
MIIEEMQATDTSLEELIRQSLQEQMARVQLSPAIRELIWRRIMARVACDGEEDAEAKTLPI